MKLLSMSNEANECFCMSGMLVNQLITSDVFFHWLSFVIFLIFELILSRICLLTFPSSLFAGIMRWKNTSDLINWRDPEMN